MAGDHGVLKHDPAIERWNKMREDVYKNFRWTKATTRTAVLSMIVIPALTVYIAANQDTKWSWAGKRKGESLATKQ
ncbi:transmembrane [Pyrrhoderma noxium]|uniref:Transmembrane n=1 Tax=Pyrrhoderma noxium TaxID=2282107 RepID=A0A286UXP9_9AGAM|nr:transmembrane [Pyrrhoderma noxium]